MVVLSTPRSCAACGTVAIRSSCPVPLTFSGQCGIPWDRRRSVTRSRVQGSPVAVRRCWRPRIRAIVVSSYWPARRRTRPSVSSLVVIAPLPRFGSGIVIAVVALPCQLISTWQDPAARSVVRVTSLITARISCLRWLLVTAGASKTARRSAPARRSQASSSLVSRTGCRARAAARSASARCTAARRCSSLASRVRATSRLPGSTSSCLRIALSASNLARSSASSKALTWSR
jgi:hypothetical protein